MDRPACSRQGDAAAPISDVDTRKVTQRDREMSINPLPESGDAPVDMFYAYEPPTATKTAGKTSVSEYLTWSFLQNDPNCEEMSEMRALITTIFAYSSREDLNEMRGAELVAGFRYFLPTGALAPEWIQFFDVAPRRYFDLAPLEVRCAYEREHDWDTVSMREWIHAGVAIQKQELAWPTSAESLVQDTQPKALAIKRKRKRYDALEDGIETPELQASYYSLPMDHGGLWSPDFLGRQVYMASLRQPAMATQPVFGSMNTISSDYGLGHADIPHGTLEDYLSAVPQFAARGVKRQRREGTQQVPVLSSSVPPLPHLPLESQSTHSGPSHLSEVADLERVLLTSSPVRTALSSAASASADNSASALGQDLADQDPATLQGASLSQQVHAGQQAVQHAGAVLSGPQTPVNPQGASTYAPGSRTHGGKGFFLRGWSKDRVRVWTDIQGRLRSKLPTAALSVWGDEMSRNHAPKSIDPRHCPFETTVEENLTYLTLTTTTNRQMCSRVMANWTAQQCVHYVYWAHDLRDLRSYGRTTVQKQFTKCKQWEAQNPSVPHTAINSNLRPDNNLSGADAELHDYFLYDMGKNVVNHPTGQGRHNLTVVMEHVVANKADTIRLSEAAQYARDNNLPLSSKPRFLTTPVANDGPDQTVMGNARAAYVARFGNAA